MYGNYGFVRIAKGLYGLKWFCMDIGLFHFLGFS